MVWTELFEYYADMKLNVVQQGLQLYGENLQRHPPS